MFPPNHLHLDPFLSSYPPQSSPSLVSSPPNYQHELIVASDGWCSARDLPVAHHHPIIVIFEASLSCCAACRPAAPCRRCATRRRCPAALLCRPSLALSRLSPLLCRPSCRPSLLLCCLSHCCPYSPSCRPPQPLCHPSLLSCCLSPCCPLPLSCLPSPSRASRRRHCSARPRCRAARRRRCAACYPAAPCHLSAAHHCAAHHPACRRCLLPCCPLPLLCRLSSCRSSPSSCHLLP